MCSSVDLPAPDGATSATDWPGQHRELGALQDFERGVALLIAPLDRVQEDDAGFCVVGHRAAHSYRSASTGSSRAARQDG